MKGSKATFLIVQVCPTRAPTQAWVSLSHNLIVWSPLAVTCEEYGQRLKRPAKQMNARWSCRFDSTQGRRWRSGVPETWCESVLPGGEQHCQRVPRDRRRGKPTGVPFAVLACVEEADRSFLGGDGEDLRSTGFRALLREEVRQYASLQSEGSAPLLKARANGGAKLL